MPIGFALAGQHTRRMGCTGHPITTPERTLDPVMKSEHPPADTAEHIDTSAWFRLLALRPLGLLYVSVRRLVIVPVPKIKNPPTHRGEITHALSDRLRTYWMSSQAPTLSHQRDISKAVTAPNMADRSSATSRMRCPRAYSSSGLHRNQPSSPRVGTVLGQGWTLSLAIAVPKSVGGGAGVSPREDRAHARVSAISPAVSVWRSQWDLEQDTELVGDVAAHPSMDFSLLVIELGRIGQRKHAFVPYVRVDV